MNDGADRTLLGAETATRSYEVRPASGNKEATSQYQGTQPLNFWVRLLRYLCYSLQRVNFTTCTTPEAAAHYAGLTPLERQSGTSVRGRPRIGHGGNGRFPQRGPAALYMATLSAARDNPMIKSFYTRLRAAGKPGAPWAQVARCAAVRKLLHLAFAVVTKRQDFAVSYQKPPSLVCDES